MYADMESKDPSATIPDCCQFSGLVHTFADIGGWISLGLSVISLRNILILNKSIQYKLKFWSERSACASAMKWPLI